MNNEEIYMQRCLELAKLGIGNVSPNPMVGSLLIHEGRIIGEGYHMQYGKAHAEVNCIENVADEDKKLISRSTLFVSLEPCAHYGKTPPCVDLILAHKISKVVIGCIDPFSKVDGKGIDKLKSAGVEVKVGTLEEQCQELNIRFFTFHNLKRPYIVLKWAQSANQKIANADDVRALISNDYTNRLVHKWRSEEAGIMVGTNTAIADNPSLNTRLWQGANPIRLVLDMNLRIPSTLNILNQQQRTIIFNSVKNSTDENLIYVKINDDDNLLQNFMGECYKHNIQSILVEGGAQLLHSFIDEGIWDEARVIQNNNMIIPNGLSAPQLQKQQVLSVEQMSTDTIFYYKNAAHK
jgi:diaminohydroxyphosphoribosylaminopyrimidine deaminase/5-amino-6-(5-phosphoribosylamino)uracil reductase